MGYTAGQELFLNEQISESIAELQKEQEGLEEKIEDMKLEMMILINKHTKNKKRFWAKIYEQYPELEHTSCSYVARTNSIVVKDPDNKPDFRKFLEGLLGED